MSEFLAQAEAAVRAGDPQGALPLLTAAVKEKPADAKRRIFLAQLLCVLGQWERAHTQLNVCADMDPKAVPMREMSGHGLRCELMRDKVFKGQRSPMVFGQPEAWLASLIESMLQVGQGDLAQSHHLAQSAFDAAPATAGTLDGQEFEWIADADSRLGPVLEAFVNGRYYWIPFNRLSRIAFEAPQDLRDCVWTPAQLVFANGGEVVAMVPTRYPGSQASADGLIQLARKTEWRDGGADRWFGLGQRVFTTNLGDHDLMTVRRIDLSPTPVADDVLDDAAGGPADSGAGTP